jgi:hypothetical protein
MEQPSLDWYNNQSTIINPTSLINWQHPTPLTPSPIIVEEHRKLVTKNQTLTPVYKQPAPSKSLSAHSLVNNNNKGTTTKPPYAKKVNEYSKLDTPPQQNKSNNHNQTHSPH